MNLDWILVEEHADTGTTLWRARREQEASASVPAPAAPARGPVWPFPPQPMDYPCLPPVERPVRAPAPALADIPAAPF